MSKHKKNSETDPYRGILDEDIDLARRIDEFFRAEKDILEVKSDPDYGKADALARLIVQAGSGSSSADGRRQFIESSLRTEGSLRIEEKEIIEIKEEICSKHLDDLTDKWVNDWQIRKKQGGNGINEIRDFVLKSLSEKESRKEQAPIRHRIKPVSLPPVVRYLSGAAAILAGMIIVFTSLIRPGDTERLFSKYYEPVTAVSPVTRDAEASNSAALWTQAVTSFNRGDYGSALSLFAEISSADPSHIPPRFFSGLSHLGLGNYNEASEILKEVSALQGEYSKEATWYLGLAYLRSDNVGKAVECFKTLAEQPGYYSDRSARLLRRLKK